MLHPEAVETSILELIQKLQSKKYLHGFYLVGGTALALKMGYRKSVDIDLFSNFNFDSSQMLENIHQDFPFQLYYSDSNTLKGSIDNVKVDILAHRYKYIGEHHWPVLIQNPQLKWANVKSRIEKEIIQYAKKT